MEEIVPPASITEEHRPRTNPRLLSNPEKDRLLERGFLGLYRWYVARSQEMRNWNADKSFEWKNLRTDFAPEVTVILEGFFAVEQYVPDFTSRILDMVRRSHGRSHFTLRWGSEEERHADTWENAVLFSKGRTPRELEDYKYQLRSSQWEAPWDNALYTLIYTVFQERATQLNYLNLRKIALGQTDKPHLMGNADPVLAKVAQTIAVDEAAHYHFFLECARLFLYYYPEKTLEAIRDVITHFAMPAYSLVPDWDKFFETVYRAGIYGPRDFQRDVVQIVFKNLGIASRKALEDGIRRTRQVPTVEGQIRSTAIWDSFDYGLVEGDVQRFYTKIATYEQNIGFSEIDPTLFVPNPQWPTQQETTEPTDT
ncbi:MAG: acyl-ACP desaturase [Deinococcaceae bacterium]